VGGSILVTGAGGCIGSWVIKALQEDNRDVVAMDIEDNRQRLELITTESDAASVPWVVADIADLDSIDKAVSDYGVDAIIHLAALQVPFCKANPVVGAQVNVVGTINIFEIARKHEIQQLAYASSVAAHGRTLCRSLLAGLAGTERWHTPEYCLRTGARSRY